MLELKNHSFARGELVERGLNFLAEEFAVEFLGGIGEGAIVRNGGQQVDFVAGVIHDDGVIFAAGFFAAELVETEVGDDAVDPGIERALEAEVADVAVGFEEGFLVDIFRIAFRTGEMEGEAEDLVLVLADEGVKGYAGAGLRFADEFHLRGAGLGAILSAFRRVDSGRDSHTWEGLYLFQEWTGYARGGWPGREGRNRDQGGGVDHRIRCHRVVLPEVGIVRIRTDGWAGDW